MSEGNVGVALPAAPAIFGIGATASTGSVTIVSVNNLVMTGIGMTLTLSNQVISRGDALEGVVGVASTGGLGDESVTGTANVDITGIGMTGGIGTVEAAQTATILQTGVSLTSSVGTVDVADVVMGPTGIEMTASVGNAEARIPITLVPTGIGMTVSQGGEETIFGDSDLTIATSDGGTLSMTARVGTPVIGAAITFSVSGVSATSSAGNLFFWDDLATGSDGVWSSLSTGTDVTWDKVA